MQVSSIPLSWRISSTGRCCIELKEYDKAEDYVKQALQAQPESLDCLKVFFWLPVVISN